MIHEIWHLQLADDKNGESWPKFKASVTKRAAAHRKDDLVLDAWGARSETGNDEQMHTALMVIAFDSLKDREEYWSKGPSDEMKAIQKESDNGVVTRIKGHTYLTVYK